MARHTVLSQDDVQRSEELQRESRRYGPKPTKKFSSAGTEYRQHGDGTLEVDVTFPVGYTLSSAKSVTLPKPMAKVPGSVLLVGPLAPLSGTGLPAGNVWPVNRGAWTRSTIYVACDIAGTRARLQIRL